jgi:DNA repair exonuclease SbcCD nuclease subunit
VDVTAYRSVPADIRLLCLHAAVEGAQVGTHNYTFREGRDVVRGHDVPNGFAAVLAGHIHRGQLLAEDLSGRPLPAPVIYPGSVERTAFAERLEEKGYVLAEFGPSKDGRGKLLKAHFIPLPTRPMMSFVLPEDIVDGGAVRRFLRRRLGALDQHAVVRIQVRGPMPREVQEVLSAPVLRALAPPTMNVTVGYPRSQLGGAARVTGGKQ